MFYDHSRGSPQRRASDRRLSLPRGVKVLLALLPLAAALAVVARAAANVETRTHADSVYVSKATYALQRQQDSSSNATERNEARHILFGLDSSDRCRRGQKDYCR